MRDAALAAVLAVLAGAGLCAALPMDMVSVISWSAFTLLESTHQPQRERRRTTLDLCTVFSSTLDITRDRLHERYIVREME